jgi:hypothetical protein
MALKHSNSITAKVLSFCIDLLPTCSSIRDKRHPMNSVYGNFAGREQIAGKRFIAVCPGRNITRD